MQKNFKEAVTVSAAVYLHNYFQQVIGIRTIKANT